MNDKVKRQSYTEKCNSLNARTEYFDLGGNIFAYYGENILRSRLEFYIANGAFIKFKKY